MDAEQGTPVSPGRAAGRGTRAGSRTPSADLKGALTDAAEAVLMREGPGAVTVRAVAAEAGVAPMGVYNRFGSKDGLIEALLIRGFQGLTAALVAREGETDPISRLWGAGVRYREFALSHRSHYALMFGDQGGREWQASSELGVCADSSFQTLVDHVAMMIAAGRFTEGDPVMVAQQIWSAVHGSVDLEMAGRLAFADVESGYRHLLRMVIRSFAMPGSMVFPVGDGPPVAR